MYVLSLRRIVDAKRGLTVKLMPRQVFGACVGLAAVWEIADESLVFFAARSGSSLSVEALVAARDRLAVGVSLNDR